MHGSASASSLADWMTPLATRFGDRLTLQRDGASARWIFEEHSVVVDMQPSGAIAATFVEPPSVDHVSARLASGVYYSRDAAYPTTRAGCDRMVSDMLAFFSGVREPRFRFADALLLEV